MAHLPTSEKGYLYLRILSKLNNYFTAIQTQPSTVSLGSGNNLAHFHSGTFTYDALDNSRLRPLDLGANDGTRGTLMAILLTFLRAFHSIPETERVSLLTVWYSPLVELVFPDNEDLCTFGTDAVVFCHSSTIIRDNVSYRQLAYANRYFFINGRLSDERILVINGTISDVARVAVRFAWIIRDLFFTLLNYDPHRTPFFYVHRTREETPGVGRVEKNENRCDYNAEIELGNVKGGILHMESTVDFLTSQTNTPSSMSSEDVEQSVIDPFLLAVGQIYFNNNEFGSL